MVFDNFGEKTNSDILKSIAKTFEVKKTTSVMLKPPYQIKNILDDEKMISQLILTDQNNKKIIIDESKYLDWRKESDYLGKPSYHDLILSPDNKYLFYTYNSAWEVTFSNLYNIQNRKFINLNIDADNMGFSPDSKYFFACAEGGFGPAGAYVIELKSDRYLFISEKSYKCQYDKNTNKVTFSKIIFQGSNEEKISQQYEFFNSTGILTKIE
jgi:hypothetical protein